MPFRTAPRLRAFDYRGLYRYSLTICVRCREPVFTSSAIVAPLLLEIGRAAAAAHFAVIAYCFMPDHLHLLVEGRRDDADLRAFVKLLKQRTSYVWKRSRSAGLWQRGYFDHVLRDEDDTVTVARYILGNPVRAGIAAAPLEYALSGSLVMGKGELLGSL